LNKKLHWATKFLLRKVFQWILANFGVLNPNMPSVLVYHVRFSRYKNIAFPLEAANFCS